MLTDALIAPFTEFEFMRRALAAVIALSLGGAPIGVFLMLRRMSLVGDAMAHAILPGAAIGFLLSGLNLFAMTTGGLIAGFAVAILAGVVARTTELKEDASLATFYLVSLALGVTIVSIKGTNIDLLHVLFGNILAMDNQTLLVIAFNATITLLVLAVIYRPLVIECVDPVFLRTVSRAGAPAHLAFLALVVINLVNGFHALGTLLGVGLMILPAGIARFWSRDITGMICIAVASAMVSGYAGLVLSFQTRIPSGPAIILVAAGALSGIAPVRQCQRAGPADVSRPAPRGVMAMRRFTWLVCLVLTVAGPARAEDRLKVVASFSILADLVRNVGGSGVDVAMLVGPDGDAHVYEPTPSDAKKIAAAKLVFVNGFGLEGWLPRLVQAAGGKAAVVIATSGIAPLKLGPDADPHAWQSVTNAKIYVANIREALVAADPGECRSVSRQRGGLSGEARRAGPRGAGGGGNDSARPPQGDLDPRRLRLFRRRLWHRIHRSPGGLDRIRGQCPRYRRNHHPNKTSKNSGDFSGKHQRSAPDPPDSGRDRRQGRRDPLFGQFDTRKGRCPHLH